MRFAYNSVVLYPVKYLSIALMCADYKEYKLLVTFFVIDCLKRRAFLSVKNLFSLYSTFHEPTLSAIAVKVPPHQSGFLQDLVDLHFNIYLMFTTFWVV